MSVYDATTEAIRNFALAWAIERARRIIRVSGLCPGPMDTPA
jgi:NAD(P)-dependent dehydrogenase (short-subunit alcohol dehydrogenase family)